MPIVVRIDVELAKRKMSVGEFAERVGGRDRVAGDGINVRGHAAPVVAVKTHPALHINFRLRPRPKNQTHFRTGDESVGAAGVRREEAGHVEVIKISAHSQHAAYDV